MVDQEVVVTSRIAGVVETIVVDRGSVVTQGQVLATLDAARGRRERPRSQGRHGAAEGRVRALASPSRPPRSLSAADLDEKKAQYAVAVARWEKAKTLRDYTVIRAPFAGIVTEKYARVGQKVIEDKDEPLFKITAVEPLLARVYLPEEELLNVKVGDPVEVVAGSVSRRPDDGRCPVHQPDGRRRERHLPGRHPRPARGRPIRAAARDRGQDAVHQAAPTASRGPARPMPHRPRSSARLRATLDRVLVHDIKNMSFRLRLLLSNLDEHWEDPEFRQTVQELLASTVERLEDIVGRFSAHEDAVLIKVALDVNGLLREVAERPARRARSRGAAAPAVSLALGAVPRIWGDSVLPRRRLREPARERPGGRRPEGKVLVRSYAGGTARRPRAIVEIIDNGAGHVARVPPGPALPALRDDQARGRRARPGDGQPDRALPPRARSGSSPTRAAGTLVRLSFPAIRGGP